MVWVQSKSKEARIVDLLTIGELTGLINYRFGNASRRENLDRVFGGSVGHS
jgi:hypothetical protein